MKLLVPQVYMYFYFRMGKQGVNANSTSHFGQEKFMSKTYMRFQCYTYIRYPYIIKTVVRCFFSLNGPIILKG